MSRALPPALVALTPGDLCAGGEEDLLRRVEAACRAGLCGVLVREPGLADRELLALARRVRDLLPQGGWLGVHDRIHLAAAAGAQAVHLGFRSLAPAEARAILPDAVAIGFSAHAGDDLASLGVPDYLFLGPVRPTPSKRGLAEALGIEGLAAAARASPRPVWGIGGLRPEDVPPCLEAGAAGVAVLRGILGSASPREAAADYVGRIARIIPG